MASYNKIQLTGKLNDVPDVKATTSGHSLAKFTLVVPRVDSQANSFDYIRVTAWRENADKAAAFSKDDIKLNFSDKDLETFLPLKDKVCP